MALPAPLTLKEYHDEKVKAQIKDDDTYLAQVGAGTEKKKAQREAYERIAERYGFEIKKRLVIHLFGDRRIAVDSFESALGDLALLKERAIGFSLKIEVCSVKCELVVPWYGSNLQLEVSPDRESVAKGLFAEIRRWVDTVRPPKWQAFWRFCSDASLQWSVLVLALLGIGAYLILFAPDTSADARASRFSQTSELLKIGINGTNQFKAMELILSYESGIIPSSKTIAIPAWAIWFAIFGTIFCVALCFVPTVILGIGQGEDAVRKWKLWMKVVGISFPVWIFGNLLLPKLTTVLQRLF